MAVIIVIIIGLTAVAVDFMRYTAAVEQLKTAGDAAAIAGAHSATRYVELEIYTGTQPDVCCDEDGCWPCCSSHQCTEPNTVTIRGPEKDLIERGTWTRVCCTTPGGVPDCGCRLLELKDRWVVYEKNNPQSAATLFFWNNIPKEMTHAEGGTVNINNIRVFGRGSPYYPSVVVESSGRVKTLFMSFLTKMSWGDYDYLNARDCSQGGTYYYSHINNKWTRTARDACR